MVDGVVVDLIMGAGSTPFASMLSPSCAAVPRAQGSCDTNVTVAPPVLVMVVVTLRLSSPSLKFEKSPG